MAKKKKTNWFMIALIVIGALFVINKSQEPQSGIDVILYDEDMNIIPQSKNIFTTLQLDATNPANQIKGVSYVSFNVNVKNDVGDAPFKRVNIRYAYPNEFFYSFPSNIYYDINPGQTVIFEGAPIKVDVWEKPHAPGEQSINAFCLKVEVEGEQFGEKIVNKATKCIAVMNDVIIGDFSVGIGAGSYE